MKKLISLLLVLVLALSLCGCGKAPENIAILYDGEEAAKLRFDINEDYDDDELTLTAVLSPKGAEGEIKWKSSDRDTVKVTAGDDGSCRLTLKQAGSVKVTASCGELKETVKIYVDDIEAEEADALPAEESDTAGEPAEEAAPAPAAEAESKLKLPEHYFLPTQCDSGAPFTPADIINNGVLSAATKKYGILLSLFDMMKNGTDGASYYFGEDYVDFEMKNGLFNSVYTRTGGRSVDYRFEYKDSSISKIYADFKDGNSSTLEFFYDGTGYSVEVNDYGGFRQVSTPFEQYSVDLEKGGFSITIGDGNVLFSIGTSADRALVEFAFGMDGGLGLHQISITCFDGQRYFFSSLEEDGFIPDSADLLYHCLINGLDCTVFCDLLDNANLSCEDYEKGVSVMYNYQHDAFSFGIVSSLNGDGDDVFVDADGNITAG